MSVYQKKNGKWYCRGRVNDERYHKLCDGAKSEKQAVAIEDGIRYQIRQVQLGLAEKEVKKTIYTVEFMCKKYLEYSKANKATYRIDIIHTNFFKNFFGAKTDILKILPNDIEAMKVELKTHKNKKGEFLKNSSVNRYYSSLKKAYNVMIENEFIEYNPCCKVKKYLEDNKRSVVLPENLQEEFLRQLPSDLHRVIVLVALHTGFRKNNVLNLRKEQININKKYIKLTKSENKGKKVIIMPLNSFIFDIIKHYYDLAEDYLFINPDTYKPFTTLLKSIKTAGRKVGIEDLHFHDFRRTFGTRLLEKGTNLRVIQELLAHSDIAVTERYLCVEGGEKESALETLVS